MAERIARITPAAYKRRVYPWEEWADGSAWEIRQGVDFDSPLDSMRNVLYMRARRTGTNITVSRSGADTLQFQFLPAPAGT
jgi:hypothetical protein